MSSTPTSSVEPDRFFVGAHHAVGAPVLAVERHDAVDEVLQQARPGERPVLGDLPNQDHCHAARLGRP
jgi:hypothetical protein